MLFSSLRSCGLLLLWSSPLQRKMVYHYWLGGLCFELNEFEDAITHYTKVLKIQGDKVTTHSQRKAHQDIAPDRRKQRDWAGRMSLNVHVCGIVQYGVLRFRAQSHVEVYNATHDEAQLREAIADLQR